MPLIFTRPIFFSYRDPIVEREMQCAYDYILLPPTRAIMFEA